MPLTKILRFHAPTAILTATMLGAAIAVVALPHANAQSPSKPAATTSHGSIVQHVDRRLAALKHKIGITKDEETAWQGFAQVSRDNATAMEKMYRQREEKLDKMNAVENMESFAAIQSKQADDINKLSAAFNSLYTKLTPDQQKQIDATFRAAAERRMKLHSHVKHGTPSHS